MRESVEGTDGTAKVHPGALFVCRHDHHGAIPLRETQSHDHERNTLGVAVLTIDATEREIEQWPIKTDPSL